MPRDWLINAKEHWLHNFDWRKSEDYINSFPNFTADVQDDLGYAQTLHFVALFSAQENAIPLVLYHGWPGSFLEFLPMLDLLRKKYTPETLPYHVLVPSITGYAYSSGPPGDVDYAVENASEALNSLAAGLFPQGYLAQGGDLGSLVVRYQGANCAACKGMHLNLNPAHPPENADELEMSQIEADALPRAAWFNDQVSLFVWFFPLSCISPIIIIIIMVMIRYMYNVYTESESFHGNFPSPPFFPKTTCYLCASI